MKSGSLGEIAVAKELIKQGYEVYSGITYNTKYDLLAILNGQIYRVEVKSTKQPEKRSGAYKIGLKRTRSNTKKNTIYLFDNTEVDILGVYLEDIDKVMLFEARAIKAKSALTIRTEDESRSTISGFDPE